MTLLTGIHCHRLILKLEFQLLQYLKEFYTEISWRCYGHLKLNSTDSQYGRYRPRSPAALRIDSWPDSTSSHSNLAWIVIDSLHYAKSEPQCSDALNILNFSEFEPYDSYTKWVLIVSSIQRSGQSAGFIGTWRRPPILVQNIISVKI